MIHEDMTITIGLNKTKNIPLSGIISIMAALVIVYPLPSGEIKAQD
jgi:hypothetical protein